MKKIIPFLLFAAFSLIATMSSAQKYSLEGVGRISVRNMGAIVEKNVIKGYFMFYQSEKIDKKKRQNQQKALCCSLLLALFL